MEILTPCIIKYVCATVEFMFRKINSFCKDILLFSRLFYLVYPFRNLFLFLYNFSKLTDWISSKTAKMDRNDFYRPFRKYSDRINGYQYVLEKFSLDHQAIVYLEFGVASGVSFRWWMERAMHPESRFFGFDTFEGLPEDWGMFYKKGDMKHEIMTSDDNRHRFVKGLFQDVFTDFIRENHSE